MNAPWELIDGYLDESLSEAELAELRQWLKADRAHVRLFLLAVHDHGTLRAQLQSDSAAAGASLYTINLQDLAANADAVSESGGPVGAAVKSRASTLRRETKVRWERVLAYVRRKRLTAAICCAVGCVMLAGFIITARHSEPLPTLTLNSAAQIEPAKTLTASAARFLGQSRVAPLRRIGTWLQGFVPTVGPGSVIRVGSTGSVQLTYTNESTVVVANSGTILRVLSPRHGKSFELVAGTLEVDAAPQSRKRPFSILTKTGVVRVTGTKLSVSTGGKSTRVKVMEGHVELDPHDDRPMAEVRAGQIGIAAANGPATVQTIRPITNHFGSGSILREYWLDVRGMAVADLTGSANFPGAPAGRELLAALETPDNGPRIDSYGARIRGYLHAPITGDFTFWIAADDAGELWLSTDERPENKRLICEARTWSLQPQNWWNEPAQESALIRLEAGRRYYIEALHKEAGGGDSFAVAWQPPGAEIEIISGAHLSPLETPVQNAK